MREEMKALRAEVERLRAEVEQQHKGTASADAGTTERSDPAVAPAVTGPSASSLDVPSLTAANFSKPLAVATSGQPAVPAAISTADVPAKKTKIDPFSDVDWTWLNGNPRTKEAAFDSKFFTPEIRADVSYTYDFNKPVDNSMGGSSEIFRSNEIQLEQLGIGGDFHYDNVRARFMTQYGMYSDNDAAQRRHSRQRANGILTLPTAIFPKLMADITSTC